MSQEQVVQLLGPPIEVDKLEWGQPDDLTLQFAADGSGARWYPMLWVHLRKGKVREVYAKRYVFWGADDRGVYGLGEKGPWETDEFNVPVQCALSLMRRKAEPPNKALKLTSGPWRDVAPLAA